MTTLAVAIVVGVLAASSPQPTGVLPIEREAARMLADDAQTFAALGDLSDRLRAALANPAEVGETRGRLTLLWVRAMRRTLGAIPFTTDGANTEPHRTWLSAHQDDVVYNEPGGQWQLQPDSLWRLHDGIKTTASAEPLAWETVENGLAGECEGYVPCYLAGLDRLHAEYLRRHPRGAHAVEAVEQVRESNEQSVRLINDQKPHEFFNPKTDCVDLVPKAESVRTALVRSGVDATAAIALLDTLRARCPR